MSMLNSMALGIKLTVQSAGAEAAMKRFGRTVDGVRGKAKTMGRALGKATEAINQMKMISIGMNLALGFAAKKAADFEQGMSAVQAVLLKNKEEMGVLTAEAKRMGRTTVFSATQAANGMEAMARAGFNDSQIMKGLSGVMDAAAADGMSLARATTIVADTIKGLGLTADDATRVADNLALASARTNTDISQLGEGLKYVAGTAKTAGMTLEETVAGIALLQDAGLKGSMAGTAMTTMLTKMAKMTPKAEKAAKNLGMSFRDSNGNLLPFEQAIKQLQMGLSKTGGSADKMALAMELFGIRGQQAGIKLVDALSNPEKSIGKFTEMLVNAEGAAKKMAEIRLDNLKGQLTLLASAVEGVAIELFTGINAGFTEATKSAANFFQEVAEGMAGEDMTTFGNRFGAGFKQAFDIAGAVIEKITGLFGKIGTKIDEIFGEGAAASIGKGAGLFTLFVAVAAPLAAIIAGIAISAKFLGAVVAPVIIGMKILAGVFGAGFVASSEQGQGALGGLAQTISNWITSVGAFFSGFFTTISEGWGQIRAAFMPAFMGIKRVIDIIISAFDPLFADGASGAFSWGEALGTIVIVLAHILGFIAEIIATAVEIYVAFKTALIAPLLVAFRNIFGGFMDLISGATSVGNAVARIFGGIGDLIIAPFKAAIAFMMNAAASILQSSVGGAVADFMGMDSASAAASLRAQANKVQSFSMAPARQAATSEAILKEVKSQKASKASPEAAKVSLRAPTQPVKVKVASALHVNGREMAVAQAENEVEVQDRSGFSHQQWQRRAILEHGAMVPS